MAKRKQRVDCFYCENFTNPEYETTGGLLAKEIKKAKCSLGKRIMFRMPTWNSNDYGYIRHCEDYKET